MKEIRLEFDLNDPNLHSSGIKQARANLVRQRKETRFPRLLEWQVHLYDFILARAEPNKAAFAYLEAKNRDGIPLSHSEYRLQLARGADAVGFTEPLPPAGT